MKNMERIGLGNRYVAFKVVVPSIKLRSTLPVYLDGYVDLAHGGSFRGGTHYSCINFAYANIEFCIYPSNIDGM